MAKFDMTTKAGRAAADAYAEQMRQQRLQNTMSPPSGGVKGGGKGNIVRPGFPTGPGRPVVDPVKPLPVRPRPTGKPPTMGALPIAPRPVGTTGAMSRPWTPIPDAPADNPGKPIYGMRPDPVTGRLPTPVPKVDMTAPRQPGQKGYGMKGGGLARKGVGMALAKGGLAKRAGGIAKRGVGRGKMC